MFDFFKKKKIDPKEELKKLIGHYELPSFSMAIMKILKTLRDPNFSADDVAEQLEIDPGLHVKVLKVVNSAAFGFSTEVKNLRHAVALLGKSRLETIVLSRAVNENLPGVNHPFFDMKNFWLHSARRASLARALAHLLHPATQAESFAIGLLQDMGLPVLVDTYPDKYEDILALWSENPHKPLHIIEREYFDFDHFTIGGLMAGEWKLPDNLVAAISRDNPNDIDPSINILAFIALHDEELIKDAVIKVCVRSYNLEEEAVSSTVDEALEAAKELSSLLR